MNPRALEVFLARLYTDEAMRRAFLGQPATVAREAGLDEVAVLCVARIDREGLVLAAESYARKRAAHAEKRGARGMVDRVHRWLVK